MLLNIKNNDNDEEAISLVKNGEPEAFKLLVDRYASAIYNFAARLTNKNEARDITQETFIKAWKNIKKFDETKASFKTWIFIIAKNTATDFLRKKKNVLFSDLEKNFIEEETDSFAENIPDENLLPEEALQKLQDFETLNAVLSKIPLNYKTVLILHYQEEMTFDEIGKILDKSLNTVKSWHRRAIILLRKMLTP